MKKAKESFKTDLRDARNEITTQVNQIEDESVSKVVLACVSKVRELNADK